MTSNMWALIVGGITAGGVLAGAVIWHQNHPDVPLAQLANLTVPPSLKAPPMAPPGPKPARQAAKTEGIIKGPPPKPEPRAEDGEPPHFDVVRVEPSGDAVIAGKGDRDAKVALLASGKVVAETKSDAEGQFVILPPPLRPGNYDLTLRQTPSGRPTVASKQNVAVSVPVQPKGQVVIALAEPGKPTKVLSGPPESPTSTKPAPTIATAPQRPEPPAAAAPQPKTPNAVALAKPETALSPPAALKPTGPSLAIRSVELENGNGFYVTGVAAAGTRIQIYLNGVHLTEVVAGASNDWSLTVRKGLTGGHYIVRADASAKGRVVTARVEVAFDVPVAMAEAADPRNALKEQPRVHEPKPHRPPPAVAARMPPGAPPPRIEPSIISGIPRDVPRPDVPEPTKVAATPAPDQTKPKPNPPPPAVAERMPQVAPPPEIEPSVIAGIPRDVPRPDVPEPTKVAATPAPDQTKLYEPKPNEPPLSVAARIPHAAPPQRAANKLADATKPVAPPRLAAPEAPATIPLPRPDVAAAAKKAETKAPALAPPVLAVAPPTPAGARPAQPPSQMAVSPPRPPAAPPTLSAVPPAVAPPKQAAAPVATPPSSQAATASAADPARATDPAHAVIDHVETAVVIRGDNLWNISRDRLGVGYRYTQIYAANTSQIRNPNMIYPGQVFVVPPR